MGRIPAPFLSPAEADAAVDSLLMSAPSDHLASLERARDMLQAEDRDAVRVLRRCSSHREPDAVLIWTHTLCREHLDTLDPDDLDAILELQDTIIALGQDRRLAEVLKPDLWLPLAQARYTDQARRTVHRMMADWTSTLAGRLSRRGPS